MTWAFIHIKIEIVRSPGLSFSFIFADWLDNLAVSGCHIFVPWALLPYHENMEKLVGKRRKVVALLTYQILMPLETTDRTIQMLS